MLLEFLSWANRVWLSAAGANRSCPIAAKGSSEASANRAILAMEHPPSHRQWAIAEPLARPHVSNATTDCAVRESLPTARGFAFRRRDRSDRTIGDRRVTRAGTPYC